MYTSVAGEPGVMTKAVEHAVRVLPPVMETLALIRIALDFKTLAVVNVATPAEGLTVSPLIPLAMAAVQVESE